MLAHRVVVRGEPERNAVEAILVLGVRMRAVVHVDDPRVILDRAQGAFRRDIQFRDREQRSGIVPPSRFLARLQ